jgi:glyoxylase-like metal-dependent hydrolase (beta-lactamase superfamily II)
MPQLAPSAGANMPRPHSRREFLAAFTAGFAATSVIEGAFARAAVARAQSAGAASNLFDLEKVADGVYAALARPATLINSNAAIFVNERDVVVMETHSNPSAAASLIAQIAKELTPKPVKYAVNSHFHWDPVQGNSAFRHAHPKVEFVATEPTRRLMAQATESLLKESLEELHATIEETRKNLSAAKTPRGKEFYQKMLAAQEAYGKEMSKFTLELPTVTCEKSMVLHDKAHSLHFGFYGRGHTAGDLVIFCPEKKVIATGDLVHGFLPYMADGFPREWPKTLDAVGQLSFDRVIGGRGSVHQNRVRFNHFRDYIDELTAKVAEGMKSGKFPFQLKRSITPASLRSLQTDNYLGMIEQDLARFTPLVGHLPIEVTVADSIRHVFRRIDD